MMDHYSLLKISPDADHSEIKMAFLKFKEEVEAYGPGIHLNDEEIKKQFPEICEAYEMLLDPAARKQYDATLDKPVTINKQPYQDTEDEPATSKITFTGILSYIGFAILFILVLYAMSFFFAL